MTEDESHACRKFGDNKLLVGDEFKDIEIGLIDFINSKDLIMKVLVLIIIIL